MLAQQLRRLKSSRNLDALVLATTTNPTDDPLVELARAEGVVWYRGDEHDVLGRYLGAARASNAELVVRMTADCPLIDAEIVDLVVAACSDGCDYASNTVRRTYPRGLDVEAFHFDVLERIARMATSRPAREHVTYYIHREHPELFIVRSVTDTTDHSDLRWTVDTEADLRLVRAIYDLARLHETQVPYAELVREVIAHPELSGINAEIVQKAE